MNPSPPQPPFSPSADSIPKVTEMENHIPSPLDHEEPSSSLWDWSDLLDFTFDDGDQFNFSLDSNDSPPQPEQPPILEKPANSGQIRKRDPKLTCENFLAGRVPCACPEMDAKMEEEGLPGKKRTKTVRAAAVVVRCQVPECEADISELKGYHRRHRVCLRCANAKEVVLDRQRKRYCQQCGKFHILSDFDEGKRSCRRKLERHNNRRRRKPSEPSVSAERESEGLVLSDDLACEDENGKDSICLSSQMAEREPLPESEEGQISILCSNPSSKNVQSGSVVSFTASDVTQIDGEKDESKCARSAVYRDKKSAYSSVCPTGRISFKLYDWNPAEFPRRLRHQIFQWLANMPVELEGYIRPGCTILTVFITMPNFMWRKLLQEPIVYIGDFVAGPEKMLSGRGSLLVYLDNMIFRVVNDGTSVMPIKVEEQAPRLHYVRPTCFEAGKPMEFVACGSNLLQPNFRLLVSFGGKYLAYDYSVPPQHGDTEGATTSFENQLLKINIPHTEPDLFGPAFIEVENQSGLSNFIPILIGSPEICLEMEIMEQSFEASLCPEGSELRVTNSLRDAREVSNSQTSFSQFLLDTAWLSRNPVLEDLKLTSISTQIRRFNRLLNFLIQNKSIRILERVLQYMETVMDNMKLNCLVDVIPETEMELLKRNMDHAGQILHGRLMEDELRSGNCLYQSARISIPSVISSIDQDLETTKKGSSDTSVQSSFQDQSGNVPLINKEVIMNMTLMERPIKPLGLVFTKKYLISRPLILAVASAAVCLGICAVFIHPQEVGKIAATIRRSLFDNRSPSC